MIFLSDGEDHVSDEAMYDVCRGAVRQGFVPLYFLNYFAEFLTTQTLGGHFLSTRSLSDRRLRHLRCVGWRKLLWTYRPMRNKILYSQLQLTFHHLIQWLSIRQAFQKNVFRCLETDLQIFNQVRLAETFLGIAESLRKPRGFLFSSP